MMRFAAVKSTSREMRLESRACRPEVRALVRTIELALGCIAYDSTPQDAEDVRGVALMSVQRLRNIEKMLLESSS
jgi:hypothetical protein